MFTVAQIKAAHAGVRSGADFPAYIQQIKQLGVTAYETWVADSHTDYSGKDGYQVSSQAMYDTLAIADQGNKEQFTQYLKMHQQGQTDYLTFCRHCAETGVVKWRVLLDAMTCTYYDKADREILVEKVPEA